MRMEDAANSAWNVGWAFKENLAYSNAVARSTPIQRAMSRGTVAVVKAMLFSYPREPRQTEIRTGATPHRSKLEHPTSFSRARCVAMERDRRRKCYGEHLQMISEGAREMWSSSTSFKKSGEVCRPINDQGACCGPHEDTKSYGYESSQSANRAVPERDGAGCDLTVDMLSHLGPLADLPELELCVEGLTSASLLQACTSLKSLSLNVNRLSSSAHLTASTTLVRLGLRRVEGNCAFQSVCLTSYF